MLWRFMRRSWVAPGIVSMLAACGGGFYFEVWDDDAPSVSLSVDRGSASAGQAVQMTADARDDGGIDWVFFYRVDVGGAVRIDDDGYRPYQGVAVVPSDGRTELKLFARAYDWSGNRTDSSVVTVTVTP
jgi:hypothetical protein